MFDSAGSPRIASLSVFPQERTLASVGETQQLIATAKYTDGTTRDVTHLVQYTSNNPDVVRAGADGLWCPSRVFSFVDSKVLVRFVWYTGLFT